MEDENEPAKAKKELPEGAMSYLDTWTDLYGPDAIAQGLRDIWGTKARRHGVDQTRFTPEERREARLWGFAKNGAERLLRDLLDHGPNSGCK